MSPMNITVPADGAKPDERTLPKIDPAAVSVNWSGQSNKSLFVRLPQGAIADDLKEPSIWRSVQKLPSKALSAYDTVDMVAYDQSWMAEARVTESDAAGATLAGVRIIQTPRRHQNLPQDEKHYTAWVGTGYRIKRRSDDQTVSGLLVTLREVETAFTNLYPRPLK
jgi:hypothetical protein